MTRHSFIQMSKLSNVKGRISYITSHARQENLYATYCTADNHFWNNLAKECQQEFKRSGADGKCIEARELIIALPEVYTTYEPQQVLEDFTEEFRRRYDVECVSALHHNKRKTNYHIHLIFSERRLLAEPDIKIATRSVFYDETGKRVRTKKEITDESGKVREGCTVIPKGGIYEQHLFTVKDDRFKSDPFLREVKEIYTALINRHISDPEQHLKVFNPDSIYLPTKKIGKNNPKAAEIEADNAARQEWNRTADMALISGIEETKILEIKKEEIHQKASQSIKANGWLPNLFRSIVSKAKEFLQNLIRQTALPPKPVLNMDMAEFRTMKPLDSDKKGSKEVSAPAEATQTAPVVEEKIDFSNVQIEPLFEDQVDFDTFSKSDFRAVKVKECEAVKKSKKLLKFVLDDGTGVDRVILSGIHEYYEPEELVGKTCIAITNLPPRAMMGIDSCGMLISAVHHENGEEKLHLLMVDPHIPAGAKLY